MRDPSARRGSGIRRLALAAVAFGVGFAIAWAIGATVGTCIAAGWGAAALAVLVWTWVRVGPYDAEQTAMRARAEDFSRATGDATVLVASVCSLVPVGYTILEAGRRHGGEKVALIVLAVTVVALSWALVHTIYALRYGDLYYADPMGGIDFNESDPPDYRDFAYVALTMGMTYQVSDTSLTTKAFRRTALRHALLAYLFGSIIVALLVNTVASLLR
jgi:uncharacterized membrane protein